ncbi:hypothetical protein [Embleya sp. NPDC005971]|uniref:hypothetical protein n=1 Tax=Embleya sp. NPDC005971 TaxID=3156724 RepID=UPI0033C8CF48
MNLSSFTRSTQKVTVGASVALLLALAVPMLPGMSPARAAVPVTATTAPPVVVQEPWMKDISLSLTMVGTVKRGSTAKATLTIVNNSKTFTGGIPVRLAISMFDAKLNRSVGKYLTLSAARAAGGVRLDIPLHPGTDPSTRGEIPVPNPGTNGGRIVYHLSLKVSESLPADLIKGSMSVWLGRGEGPTAGADFVIAPVSGGTSKPTTKPTAKPTTTGKPTTTTKPTATSSTPPTAPASATPSAVSTNPPVDARLARTGAASSVPMTLAGGALVVFGGVAVVGSRLRRRAT